MDIVPHIAKACQEKSKHTKSSTKSKQFAKNNQEIQFTKKIGRSATQNHHFVFDEVVTPLTNNTTCYSINLQFTGKIGRYVNKAPERVCHKMTPYSA